MCHILESIYDLNVDILKHFSKDLGHMVKHNVTYGIFFQNFRSRCKIFTRQNCLTQGRNSGRIVQDENNNNKKRFIR